MADYGANAVTSFLLRTMREHLSMRAQRALYGKPVLTTMADPYPLPAGEGYLMDIPKHVSQNGWGALTEYTIINPSGTSAARYQITVAGYGDARVYSDFWRTVNSLPSQIPNDIDDMMRYGAKKIDDICRSKISGLGTQVGFDGSTVAAITTASRLKASAVVKAGMTLADNDAPEYEDMLVRGVIRPAQSWDIFTNLSGGTAAPNVSQYIVNTDVGASKLERCTVGILGRVRVMESTWSPRYYTGVAATSAAGLSVGATGYEAYFTGRGAFAAVDLDTARLKTIVHAPGQAGAYDPIDQVGTVGCKLYFGAGAMDTTNRLVRIVSGETL